MRTRSGWAAGLVVAATLAGSAAPQQPPPKAVPKAVPKANFTPEQVAKLRERDLLMKELPEIEKSGKLAVAVAVVEKAAALQREVIGEKGEILGSYYVTLGRLNLARQDWAAARAAYRKAGDTFAAHFGADDWEVTNTRLAQADVDVYEKMTPADRAAAQRAVGLSQEGVRQQGLGKSAAARPLFEEAAAIRKRLFGENHPGYARSLDNLAVVYGDVGEYRKSESLHRQALAIRKQVLGANHPDCAHTLNNLGALHVKLGEYQAAEPLLREAVSVRKNALGDNHAATATALHSLAGVYSHTGEFGKAEALYREVLAVQKRAFGEAHPEYAHSLSNLALLYAESGDYRKAEPLYRDALAILKKTCGEAHPDYALCLNGLAGLYVKSSEHRKAEPLYREVLATRKTVFGEDHPLYAQTLLALATLYMDTAEYQKAEPLYQRALATNRRAFGDGHPDVARCLHGLGVLYLDTGEYRRAEPVLLEALAIKKSVYGSTHREYGWSLVTLAQVCVRAGEFRRAEALFKESLALWQRLSGKDHPDYAQSLSALGVLYSQVAEYENAIPLLTEALDIRKRVYGESHAKYAESLHNLAAAYRRTGEFRKAEDLLRQVLAINKRALGETHPAYSVSLYALAVVYAESGQYEAAEPLFRESLEVRQASLDRASGVQREEGQLAYAGVMRHSLSAFLDATAMIPGRSAADAYHPALRWKGQVFARQRLQRELARASADPATADLAARLLDTTRRLAAVSRTTPKPEEAGGRKAQVAALAAERDSLERDLVLKSAGFRRQKEQETLTPDQLRKHLPPGTALVDFFAYTHYPPYQKAGAPRPAEERLAAFVVRPDREIVRVELGAFAPIRDAIEAWRADTKRRRPVRGDDDPAALLRDTLWVPVAKHLDGATTVLVSPDADLARLPFGALPGAKDGAYLVEELAVAVLPVPQLLPDLLAPRPAGEPSLLAVGDVDYGADPGKPAAGAVARAGVRGDRGRGWDPLPATKAEVDAVKASFAAAFPGRPATVLRAAEPTEDAVRRELGKHRWVHLATHGFFAPPTARPATPDDPAGPNPGRAGWLDPGLASGVVLAGANRPLDPLAGADDGVLTAAEVATLDLAGVDLVVLSACETGLGKLDRTDGVLGLQRAFQVAGARTVVVSLWAVPDEATRALMTRAYANWWDGKKTRLEALVAAQRWVIENGMEVAGRSGPTPPQYWAAFVLAGDWR